MLKHLLIGSCLALALSGCATTKSSPGMAQAKNEARPPAGCVSPDTATRLPPSGYCGGVGSSHTQGDLNRTGEQNPNVGRALQMVDPAVVGH